MSTINWASATSGTWSVASNWSGGDVPGASDDAVISALSQNPYDFYTVSILSPVTIGALTISSRNASVFAQSALTAGAIDLSAGALETTSSIKSSLTVSGGHLTLDPGARFTGSLTSNGGKITLDDASLTGNVTWLGGALQLAGDTTFRNVTWQGGLDPTTGAPLTIVGGLTLTGATGDGPGQATVGRLTLDQVKELNNASITLTGSGSNILVENCPTLTFGSNLLVQNATISISPGDTLVNAGTLIGSASGDGVSGASFINTGTIQGDFTENAKSFTNDGKIIESDGAVLTLPGSNAITVGAQSTIDLSASNLVVSGVITTFDLLNLYVSDHIYTFGSSGFDVSGTLDNASSAVTIGVSSFFGTLYGGGATNIAGGAVYDLSGVEAATLTLTDLAYIEMSSAASFTTATLDNVDFSGAGVIDAQNLTLSQSTLSSVGTLNIGASLDLEGTSIQGARASGAVDVNFTSGSYLDYLTIGSQQSVSGYAFTFGTPGSFSSGTVDFAGGEINDASFTFNGGFQNGFIDTAASANETLGAQVTATLLSGELTILGQGSDSAIVNEGELSISGELAIGEASTSASPENILKNSGNITLSAGSYLYIDPNNGTLINTGTISINGGVLEASAKDLVNSGKLSVSNGTLVLDGPLTIPYLSSIAHPGSAVFINGDLSLGGQSVTFGSSQLQSFVLSGEVSDGTLAINAGGTLTASGLGLSYNATLATQLTNNGTLLATVGLGETDDQSLNITGNVTGSGVIELGAGASDLSNFISLTLDGNVSSGQTLAFMSGYDELAFGSIAAAKGFAGTLTGLTSAGVTEPSFAFDHATIASASLDGDAISVIFSGGATATLATDMALTGSLSFYESQGNAILAYTPSGGSAAIPFQGHG